MFHYIPKVLYLQYHIKHEVKLGKKKHNKNIKEQWSIRIFLVALLVMSVSPPCWSKHGGEMIIVMVVMEKMMTCCLPSDINVPQHVQNKVHTIM